MQPQDLARRVLPAAEFETLQKYAERGVPADCGPPWSDEVLKAAKSAGPHVSAMLDENVELLWEDVRYQERAGFIKIVSESVLFGASQPAELKISRVAVVPQVNRRGRIIVNLSAEVAQRMQQRKPRKRPNKSRSIPAIDPCIPSLANAAPGETRTPPRPTKRYKRAAGTHPSVNETTVPAQDQKAVKDLGIALLSIMFFSFDVDCSWEIDWQKIDLSDGFWRMIVEDSKAYNFVYQLPRRAGDSELFYVVPSSLQMGWKNSPPYFCTATESTRSLFVRLLALTCSTGIGQPHRHEKFCLGPSLPPSPLVWTPLRDTPLLSRVFVDDFMNGLAGPVGRPRKRDEQLWVARGALHAIHAVFPPPDVLKHTGGRDSVSEKKLGKGDARFKPDEVLLGFCPNGRPASKRTFGLPKDKKDRYCDRISQALAQPRNYISFGHFQEIHGKLQHAAIAMPSMRGFMTPLNRVLSHSEQTVGLGKASQLRETFIAFQVMLELGYAVPSHITELVPPDLPHIHGYVDAAAVGLGGTWLPCTAWVIPTVFRLEFPKDIADEVRKSNSRINNNDVEAAGAFVAELMVEDVYGSDTAGISSHLGCDNTPTVGWFSSGASKGTHRQPERMLRWSALRQRFTRRGPQDITHVSGLSNTMADFSSRSYEQGFADDADESFLAEFSHRYPLPPQLGYWRLVRPKSAIVSAVFSLLRGHNDTKIHPATIIGKSGLGLPVTLANTLSSLTCRDPPSTWNEATCSWPLLAPCGMVSTTVASQLRARKSRRRFSGADNAWSTAALQTLGERISVPRA